MKSRQHVINIGEAISVLVQTAQMAQKSGILSLDEAVIVKSAIDFLNEMNSTPIGPQGTEEPQTEVIQ